MIVDSATSPHGAGPEDTGSFSRRIPLIVAAAFFMETLDSTIVTTALPAIGRSLGATTLDAAAGITVYLVGMAAFVPMAGWASARLGARNLFATAIAVFTLASLGCGVAPSLPIFLAARLLQGTAAAFMSPVGRLVVLNATPKHRIIDAMSLIVWPGLIAPVIGPPLGGFITTYASWRWIFLLHIPVGVVGVLLVLRFVPARSDGPRTPFDGKGFVFTAVALAALLHGLTLVGHIQANAVSGGFYIAIGALSGGLALRHALRHPAPMLDLAAVRIPTFALCTVSAGLLARIAISMTPFLLPLMFQIGFGTSAFEAGLMLLVYMAGNLAMKSLTTPVLRTFGFRNVLLTNGLLCVAALAACAAMTPVTPPIIAYTVMFVAGLTRSMHFTSVNTLAFADIGDAAKAGATTLSAMVQQVAGALGVASAALALKVSQVSQALPALTLTDFQHALLASAGLMAIAVAWLARLSPDAGADLSRGA
jgi:EmrB/QacA subfamily drug resistance transporter